MHYSRLKFFELASNLFENLEVAIDSVNLNYNHYMAKFRAIKICSIGDDIKNMSNNFGLKVIEETTKGVKPDFFHKNRKLHNKMQYHNVEVIDDELIDKLIEQQHIHVSSFINIINKNMDLERNKFLLL